MNTQKTYEEVRDSINSRLEEVIQSAQDYGETITAKTKDPKQGAAAFRRRGKRLQATSSRSTKSVAAQAKYEGHTRSVDDVRAARGMAPEVRKKITPRSPEEQAKHDRTEAAWKRYVEGPGKKS
jgi:hypothetical protein